MKKLILIILCLFAFKVKAIDSIEIDGDNLIPVFSSDIKVYNYYTNKDNINISAMKNKNEIIFGEGNYVLKDGKNEIIISNEKDNYTINVFKNYKNDLSDEVYLTKLIIEGYDINFDKNTHEYSIYIEEEDHLDIKYELSNDNAYVSIIGNGNFNNSKNEIIINVNNKDEYKINVFKTISVVSYEKENIVEFSSIKKEIVIVLIVTISCILVFLFYYTLFINKTTLRV